MKIFILQILFLLISCGVFANDTDTISFQLQNKETGLLLRPFNASKKDGAKIVLYPQQDWRCLTWDAIPTTNGNFYFHNYFSNKSFTIQNNLAQQQPINQTDKSFFWKMVEVKDGYYKIVSATDETKVLTAPEGNDEQVQLQTWQNKDTQLWKPLPKPTHFTG